MKPGNVAILWTTFSHCVINNLAKSCTSVQRLLLSVCLLEDNVVGFIA